MGQKGQVGRKYLRNVLGAVVSNIRSFRPEENLIVFADARGGSTWMAELIGQLPRVAVLWEPLYITEVDLFRKLGFAWRQFIPELETWDEAERAFEQILRGKVLNHWLCRGSSPLDFLLAERMAVKFCRANALIPWLTRVFHFRHAPIYLVRHPFAVAASQIKHWAGKYEFQSFTIPNCPFNEPYLEHASFLSTLRTVEEERVALWCLTNLVPLRNARNNESWITVYYEHLISDPERELGRVFARWGMPLPDAVVSQVRVASASTEASASPESVQGQLSKWRSFFDGAQIEKMTAVLRYFEVEHYTTDLVPHVGQKML